MANVTSFVALPFVRNEDGELVAPAMRRTGNQQERRRTQRGAWQRRLRARWRSRA